MELLLFVVTCSLSFVVIRKCNNNNNNNDNNNTEPCTEHVQISRSMGVNRRLINDGHPVG